VIKTVSWATKNDFINKPPGKKLPDETFGGVVEGLNCHGEVL
jgi:hypothetical protein